MVVLKYLAFLDILGFKARLKELGQTESERYISRFSSTVYSVFCGANKRLIEGFIVSDSIVLNTTDTSIQSLRELIRVIDEICKREFSSNSILIRGAIAKGNFESMPAVGLSNLRKELIVGQAYVDAYILESSVKTIGIILTQDVYEDMLDASINTESIINENNSAYLYRTISLDFLLDLNNVSNFISLAKEAEWKIHYYNTIYFALQNESNDNKVDQLFENILDCICSNQPSENSRDVDVFIKNAFTEGVNANFQKRFLRFIRSKIFKTKPIIKIELPYLRTEQ